MRIAHFQQLNFTISMKIKDTIPNQSYCRDEHDKLEICVHKTFSKNDGQQIKVIWKLYVGAKTFFRNLWVKIKFKYLKTLKIKISSYELI